MDALDLEISQELEDGGKPSALSTDSTPKAL